MKNTATIFRAVVILKNMYLKKVRGMVKGTEEKCMENMADIITITIGKETKFFDAVKECIRKVYILEGVLHFTKMCDCGTPFKILSSHGFDPDQNSERKSDAPKAEYIGFATHFIHTN